MSKNIEKIKNIYVETIYLVKYKLNDKKFMSNVNNSVKLKSGQIYIIYIKQYFIAPFDQDFFLKQQNLLKWVLKICIHL
jgi:hypothetical protein